MPGYTLIPRTKVIKILEDDSYLEREEESVGHCWRHELGAEAEIQRNPLEIHREAYLRCAVEESVAAVFPSDTDSKLRADITADPAVG